jgi:hypothetical protein
VALLGGTLAAAALIGIALRDEASEVPVETRKDAAVRSTVFATIAPEVHRFGEPLTARLELVARKQELQPDTARAGSEFEPYEVVGPARREVSDFGPFYHLRYTLTLRCLKQACLPDGQTAEFDFSPAAVSFKTPPPPGRKFKDRRLDQRSASGIWPTVKVASRLTPQDVQEARWRSSLAELPQPSYRIAPRWIVGTLLGGSVSLVLAAAALCAGYVRRAGARRRGPEEEEAHAPPLEQALAFVDESRGNGVARERAALETLARELRAEGANGLALDAERLAWSKEPPPDPEVEALTTSVRGSLSGERS